MNRITIALIALALTTGCGGGGSSGEPRAIVITPDSSWMKEFAKTKSKLSEREAKMVAAYLFRMKLQEGLGKPGVPPGTTVGEAIALQESWIEKEKAKEAEAEAKRKKAEAEKAKEQAEAEKRAAEAQALAEKARAERKAKTARLNDIVRIALVDKGFIGKDLSARRFEEHLTILLRLENRSKKVITAIKGKAHFNDVFGDLILGVSLKIQRRVAPGTSVDWSGVIEFNQFMSTHKNFKHTPLEKVRFVYEPVAVIFEDGETITAPE